MAERRHNRTTNQTEILEFFYDASGRPIQMRFNGREFNYVLNLQGDVLQIRDPHTNAIYAQYVYSAYGALIWSTGSMAEVNPIRYRGKFWCSATSLYYLQSRYYDPSIGRFINADVFVSTGTGLLGFNMFAYCSNNPVMFVDPDGYWEVEFEMGVSSYTHAAIQAAWLSAQIAAAAAGWLYNYFEAANFVAHEFGAIIYSWGGQIGVGDTIHGDVHWIAMLGGFPFGARELGFVHTHPNYDGLSDWDIRTARREGVYVFVAGPSREMVGYHPASGHFTIGIIPRRPLCVLNQLDLIVQFRSSWNNHILTCDLHWNCAGQTWPRWGW